MLYDCCQKFEEQDPDKTWKALGAAIFFSNVLKILNKKGEGPTMQVSYNGFTGELVKLERLGYGPIRNTDESPYALIIYDIEKKVTHSFTGVKLEDVKFLGGAVSFGG